MNTQELRQKYLEGNKLIAEFMEVKFSETDFTDDVTFGGNADAVRYHRDWCWLMPIIDKIESLHSCSYCVGLQYAFAYVSDKSQHGNPYIVRATGMTRIETAYNLVIKFINWYNKTKTTT